MAKSRWRFHALAPLQFRSPALLRHHLAVFQEKVQCLFLQAFRLPLVSLPLLLLSLRLYCLLAIFSLLLQPLAILVELADALPLPLLLRCLPRLSFLSALLLTLQSFSLFLKLLLLLLQSF